MNGNHPNHKLLHFRQCPGFSLIEMAIVLAIVVSLLTLGLGALNSLTTSSAYAETRNHQARVKDALIAYFGAHKRLPCPDVPNNTNGSADSSGVTGSEDKVNGSSQCVETFGVLPYATLGLSRDIAEDGWGNLISYQVYVDHTVYVDPADNRCPGRKKDWSDPSCFGAGKGGGIQIKDGLASSPTSGVVAVLVSHGPNGLGAWSRQGTRNAPPTTCEEAQNSRLGLGGCALTDYLFFKGERSGNDDVVAYLSADDIIQSLAKQGAILSAPAQVAEDLRIHMQHAVGQVLATGLSAPAKPSLYPTRTTDPWGNEYQIDYTAKIDASGSVTGSEPAICIYSLGPDGYSNAATCPAEDNGYVTRMSTSALHTLFVQKNCAPTNSCKAAQ